MQSITGIDLPEAILHLEETNWNLLVRKRCRNNFFFCFKIRAFQVRFLALKIQSRNTTQFLIFHFDSNEFHRILMVNWLIAMDLLFFQTAIHRVLPQDNIEQEFSTYSASHVNRNVVVEELNNLDVESNVDEIMTVPSSPVSAFRNIYHSGMRIEPKINKKLCSLRFIQSLYSFSTAESSSSSNHYSQFTRVGDHSESGSNSGISSSSYRPPKELSFNIHLKYEIHKIKISDTSTVADLKAKILSVTSIPISRQMLTGWIPNEAMCTDSTVLRTLNLEPINELILKDSNDDEFMDEDGPERPARGNEIYTINITRQPDGEKYTLQFPGRQTFLEVKTDVYTLTTIPVRLQVWTGWPDNITSRTTLAQSGIELMINVEVAKATENATGSQQLSAAPSRSSEIIEVDNSDENSSDDNDFQDANEDFNDYYTDTTIRRPIEDLSKWRFSVTKKSWANAI